MKRVLTMLLVSMFMFATPVFADGHTSEETYEEVQGIGSNIRANIRKGTCEDDSPGTDLEPAIGAAIGAAVDSGTGIGGTLVGVWIGDRMDNDEVDLGTLIFGAIGAATGGPGGAFVGALLGDWITDKYNVCPAK